MLIKATSSRAAFTVCARNYFAQALLLARSFRRHNPHCDFHVVLVDRRDQRFAERFPDVGVIWVEDIGLPDFLSNAMRFDVIEFSTNVKPHCFSKLLEHYDQVLYLDPDTYVFDSLAPVYGALDDSSILVTPASTTPILDGHRPDDIEFLRVGVFNLGFAGVSATPEGLRFARWWSDRCLSDGFHETSVGVFVDQKWVNLAPCYFDGCRIYKDPGLNMAPWNLHERKLTEENGRYLVNQVAPLRLFHFSSFDPHSPQAIARRQTRFAEGERTDLRGLLDRYASELLAAGYDELSGYEYGFDHLSTGEYISPTLRRIYANPRYAFPRDEDPFQPDSRLMRFARKHRLIGKSVKKAKRWTAGELSSFGLQVRIMDALFKLALRVLGPNRYFLFMRYLAQAASIRGQRPL